MTRYLGEGCRGRGRSGEEGGPKREVAASPRSGEGGVLPVTTVEGREEEGERKAGVLWLFLSPGDNSVRQCWPSGHP